MEKDKTEVIPPAKVVIPETKPIHNFFELTYANYLAIPRSVLQSMPVKWQANFVELLEKLDETIDWRQDGVKVTIVDEDENELTDVFVDYERGRRVIPHIGKTVEETAEFLAEDTEKYIQENKITKVSGMEQRSNG